MARALLGLVVVAGCSTPTRLLVEVDAAAVPTVHEVRVYLSATAASERQILPPEAPGENGRVLALGPTYVRDSGTLDDHVAIAGGARVVFAYEPGDANADHLTALAVGFANGVPTAYGTAFDLALIEGEIAITTIELAAANPTDRRLQVWGPADHPQACALARVDDKTVVMIAEADDFDCDGYRNDDDPAECDRYVFEQDRGLTGTPQDLSTTFDDSEIATVPACRVGTQACVDGEGPAQGGAPYCADPRTCTDACAASPFECNAATQPFIRCKLHYTGDGVCENSLSVIPPQLDFTVYGHACTGPAMLYTRGGWSSTYDENGLDLALETSGCSVTMKVAAAGSPMTVAVATSIAIPMDTPDAAGAIYPLYLAPNPVPSCPSSETSCEFVPNGGSSVPSYLQCFQHDFQAGIGPPG